MANTSNETSTATCYPRTSQYDRWKAEADELDYSSVSTFMAEMIEAGLKKFEVDVEPDEGRLELREQRNDLREELEHTRERVETLEDRLYHGERASIERFVRDENGASADEIVRHIVDTTPERIVDHLDMLEGSSLDKEGGVYYYAQ